MFLFVLNKNLCYNFHFLKKNKKKKTFQFFFHSKNSQLLEPTKKILNYFKKKKKKITFQINKKETEEKKKEKEEEEKINNKIFHLIKKEEIIQDLEPGLYIVGTPIGNLLDISLRGLQILNSVSEIYCEDTRKTIRIFEKFQLNHVKLISFHEHSHPQKIEMIIQKIQEGKSLAIVSEAGMPTISDPGSNLIEKIHELKLPLFVIPGPSAVTTAIAASGFPGDKFIFEGFLPKKSKRKKLLKELSEQHRTIIFFESPKRIVDTIEDCIEIFGEHHEAVITRELTKYHEQIQRNTLKELLEIVKNKQLGEYTIVISPKLLKKN